MALQIDRVTTTAEIASGPTAKPPSGAGARAAAADRERLKDAVREVLDEMLAELKRRGAL